MTMRLCRQKGINLLYHGEAPADVDKNSIVATLFATSIVIGDKQSLPMKRTVAGSNTADFMSVNNAVLPSNLIYSSS